MERVLRDDRDQWRMAAEERGQELTTLRAVLHRLESERDEARQVVAEQAASIDQLRAKLAEVEQEREELKAANVSVIQLATDNAKWCLEAKDRAEAAEQDRDRWRDAVLNAAVVSWIPSEDKTPREIINDLLAWGTQVALDPAVSEPAAKLKQDRDRLATDVDNLKSRLAAEIELRPMWAKGFTDDSIAAQVALSSLKQLFALLQVDNMTQAVQKLTAAQEENKRLACWRSLVCQTCHGVGEVTVTSGQTPESFAQDNIPCPDCIGKVLESHQAALMAERDTVNRQLERIRELEGEAYSNGELYNKEYLRREQAEATLTTAQQSAQEQFRAGMERAFPIILTAIKSYRSNIVCDEEGGGLELSDILATGYKDTDIRRALEELDGLHDHICACLLAGLSKGEGR